MRELLRVHVEGVVERQAGVLVGERLGGQTHFAEDRLRRDGVDEGDGPIAHQPTTPRVGLPGTVAAERVVIEPSAGIQPIDEPDGLLERAVHRLEEVRLVDADGGEGCPDVGNRRLADADSRNVRRLDETHLSEPIARSVERGVQVGGRCPPPRTRPRRLERVWFACLRGHGLCARLPRSRRISLAALWPGMPETPPPGWQLDPHM